MNWLLDMVQWGGDILCAQWKLDRVTAWSRCTHTEQVQVEWKPYMTKLFLLKTNWLGEKVQWDGKCDGGKSVVAFCLAQSIFQCFWNKIHFLNHGWWTEWVRFKYSYDINGWLDCSSLLHWATPSVWWITHIHSHLNSKKGNSEVPCYLLKHMVPLLLCHSTSFEWSKCSAKVPSNTCLCIPLCPLATKQFLLVSVASYVSKVMLKSVNAFEWFAFHIKK